jgi:hypothetical protein
VILPRARSVAGLYIGGQRGTKRARSADRSWAGTGTWASWLVDSASSFLSWTWSGAIEAGQGTLAINWSFGWALGVFSLIKCS